ncbi:transcription antitermination factor NusB [Hydrogenivirga sp. 128-5-R1-1]|uniref:transcription antitermination factor NusB n=1 Tax=Hydrogenivirga sp. 128-5-R1-1 TaxID=392423 RepID=UPI00015F1F89|nr:transcription antitermination factor NusB [Hydrogenivirga sp. 128-5-R1-1]EDP73341.1 transcription antitermination protein NusB [Hydrogenivirga sp. 128-5-R1-1]
MVGKFRKKAREIALKVLYAYDIDKEKDINETLEETISDIRQNLSEKTLKYAYQIINGVYEYIDEIDNIIQSHLKDWRLDRLGYIERALLRIGTYELVFSDIPDKKRVFMDILDIAKCYNLDEKALKFINGVLSKIYKDFKAQSKTA